MTLFILKPNKEVKGHMAEAAMLARTSSRATGMTASPKKQWTSALFLVTGKKIT